MNIVCHIYFRDPNAMDEEGKTALHYVSATKAAQASDLVHKLLHDGSDTGGYAYIT